jgi:hypothetical protein
MSEYYWSFTFILINLVNVIYTQSTQFTNTKIFINNLPLPRFKKFILVILIVIWLISGSILTKAFTGLLLNTYANIRYIPYADSFEQIYQDQSLQVHSDLVPDIYYLKNILKINSKIIENLIERDKIFRRKHIVDWVSVYITL